MKGKSIIITPKMKVHEVGKMEILFNHEDKKVIICLIDDYCDITLKHKIDFEDWKEISEID